MQKNENFVGFGELFIFEANDAFAHWLFVILSLSKDLFGRALAFCHPELVEGFVGLGI
jgi:hypothetical protein